MKQSFMYGDKTKKDDILRFKMTADGVKQMQYFIDGFYKDCKLVNADTNEYSIEIDLSGIFISIELAFPPQTKDSTGK